MSFQEAICEVCDNEIGHDDGYELFESVDGKREYYHVECAAKAGITEDMEKP